MRDASGREIWSEYLRRYIFNFAAVVSLLLCVAASLCWAFGRGRSFGVTCDWLAAKHMGPEGDLPAERSVKLSTSNGCAYLGFYSRTDPNSYDLVRKHLDEVQTRVPRLHLARTKCDPAPLGLLLAGHWSYWSHEARVSDGRLYVATIGVPLWSAVAAFLILPAVAAVVIVRGKPRQRDGLCARCSYDLTGNVSGVCPECGTPVATQTESRPSSRRIM